MRRLALVCLLALVPAAPAAVWTNIGPYGGDSRSLAADASGNNVFVLNPRSGVFRSSFFGPWTLVFDAITRGVTPTRVAVDSQTGRVYVGTASGLFRSDDTGTTWRPISDDSIIDVTAAGDRVVAATPTAVRRSFDAGATWVSLFSPT